VSSFERNLVFPKDGSNVHFSESELVSMELALKALSEKPISLRIAHAEGVLKRLRNTVARLEHPRILTTLAVEFRTRMTVSTLATCYILYQIEGIVGLDAAKAHALLDQAKALLDRAFRNLFAIYVLRAYSPVPDALREVWRRLAIVAPTAIEAEL
jgi:hypothetical protein